MSKSSLLNLTLNSTVKFTDDESLPIDIRDQTFTVTRVESLLLNDFYFNNQLFPVYELTGKSANTLFLSPFTFEEGDDELKLRITKSLTDLEIKALFKLNTVKELLNLKQEENNYFTTDDNNISGQLKHWISRTYYLDIKDQDVATCSYIQYDLGNKKNLNYSMLLKKYPFQKYSLFLGDYNSFYLEVNFDNNPQMRATAFLSMSDVESFEINEVHKEKIPTS